MYQGLILLMSQVVSQFKLLLNSLFYLSRIMLSALSDSIRYLTSFGRTAPAMALLAQANIKRRFLSSGISRCVRG